MSEDSLRQEMSKFGKVVLTSIPLKEDGKMKGFGFVQFSNLTEAKRALDDLNAKERKLAGNKVAVDWCIPKNIFQRIEAKSEAPARVDHDDESEDDSQPEQDDQDNNENEKVSGVYSMHKAFQLFRLGF